jgi:hypothetical protein
MTAREMIRSINRTIDTMPTSGHRNRLGNSVSPARMPLSSALPYIRYIDNNNILFLSGYSNTIKVQLFYTSSFSLERNTLISGRHMECQKKRGYPGHFQHIDRDTLSFSGSINGRIGLF